MKKSIKKLTALSLVFALSSVTLASCGGDDASGDSASGGKTQFKFITAISDTDRTAILNDVIAQLQEKYPDVEFVNDSGADYNNRAKLAYGSGDGYDLIFTDDLGISPIRDAGYLLDLAPYIDEYGWEERQYEGATDFYNQRTPGEQYTVGMNYAPVTVFYNKDIFAELGLEVPTTIEEFENCLKVATDNGYIGAENAKENVSGWYVQSMVQNYAPFEDILSWYYLEDAPDSVGAAFQKSFDKVKSWADAGYFRPNYEGIDYGDTAMLFAQGESAMSLDGNWFLSAYEQAEFNVGVFAFPSNSDANQDLYIINPVDAAFGVGANVTDVERQVAIDFIDIMLTQEIAEQWLQIGSIPTVKADYSDDVASPLTQELLTAIDGTKSGFYLDNAKAGLLDVFIKEVQLFMLGDQTSEETWTNIDKFWNEQ